MEWRANKIKPELINMGQEFENGDVPTKESFNAPINNSLYAVNIVDSLNGGTYNSTTTYQYPNMVEYDGSCYMAIYTSNGEYASFSGVAPTNGTYWKLYAKKGSVVNGNVLQTTGTSTLDVMSQKAVTDELAKRDKGTQVKSASVGATAGYIKIATLTKTKNVYTDGTISLKIVIRKQTAPTTIDILTTSTMDLDLSILSFTSDFYSRFYYQKSATNKVDIYVYSDAWNSVAITDYNFPSLAKQGLDLTFPMDIVTSLPSGYIQATLDTKNGELLYEGNLYGDNTYTFTRDLSKYRYLRLEVSSGGYATLLIDMPLYESVEGYYHAGGMAYDMYRHIICVQVRMQISSKTLSIRYMGYYDVRTDGTLSAWADRKSYADRNIKRIYGVK